MIDYQAIYHVGVLTESLEAAMADLGAQLGLTWCTVQEREMPVRMPDGERTVRIRFTYSAEGPQHVELLEAEPGSYWDGTGRAGLHHVGIWSDDLTADTDGLVAAGWTLEISGVAPSGGYGTFTYVRAPTGQLVELVDSRARTRFEGWWAGGDLA